MPGTVKSELLPDADRSHKCDCQEKVSWKRNLPLDKSHFITETYIRYAIAKEKAVAFIRDNSISDIDSFFEILNREYPFSAAPDDTRRKSGMVKEQGTGYTGYMGTLYFFTHISDNVYSDMVADIKNSLLAAQG